LSYFRQDRTRALGDERLEGARFEVPNEVHIAGQDHEKAVTHLADFEQRLAGAIGAHLAKSTDPLDLRPLQEKEHWGALRILHRHGRHGVC